MENELVTRRLNQASTLTEVLDFLDEYLCDGYDRNGLASVLSALRGPDHHTNQHFLKNAATVHIRANAFPKLAAKARANGRDQNNWKMETSTPFISIDYGGASYYHPHFLTHICSAMATLRRIKRFRDVTKPNE